MVSAVSKQIKKKSGYLEFIKILAMLMVLYNHRATYNLADLWITYDPRHIILQFLATACRIGVPLFFMCSGVVLLGKKESYKDIIKNRMVRILIVMVICTAIKSWNHDYSAFEIVEVFFTKLNWYLYAYVDYLLMLPFLRIIAQHTDQSMAKIYIGLVCAFYTLGGVLLHFDIYTGFVDFATIFNTSFSSYCWAVIFPLSGYFIAGVIDSVDYKELIGLLIFSGVCLAASALFVISDLRTTGGAHMDQLRVHFIYAPSLGVFCLIEWLYRVLKLDKLLRFNRAVLTISGTTFGMFIIETHSQLINYVNHWIKNSVLGLHFSPYYQGIIAVFVQFAICFCIVYILKKLPYVKKIL